MGHRERVQEEFTRQAESFRDSPVLGAAEITERVGAALGVGHQRVLDVACGPGILFPTLSACAETVVGVDLTLRSLRLAQEAHGSGRCFPVRGLSEGLPFAPASFDGAVLRLALHHFPDPARALASLRSVLRPGARLVVTDLLVAPDAEVRALRDALERFRDPSHTRVIPLDEMRSLLAGADFAMESELLWSQPRRFQEWAGIIHEPRRMADLERVLRALARVPDDPAGLELRIEDGELWFTYPWGLFVARAGAA